MGCGRRWVLPEHIHHTTNPWVLCQLPPQRLLPRWSKGELYWQYNVWFLKLWPDGKTFFVCDAFDGAPSPSKSMWWYQSSKQKRYLGSAYLLKLRKLCQSPRCAGVWQLEKWHNQRDPDVWFRWICVPAWHTPIRSSPSDDTIAKNMYSKHGGNRWQPAMWASMTMQGRLRRDYLQQHNPLNERVELPSQW